MGAQELLLPNKDLIPSLRILLSDVDYIAKEAFVCFLQLSSNTAFAHKMIDNRLVPVLMEIIGDKESNFIGVALLILGNITRVQEGSESLLQIGTDFEGVFVYKLIQKFYEGKRCEDPKEDKYKWIASIVTNLSQLEKGRHLLTKDDGKLLMLIASANISAHSIRTRGISATIKNCCFYKESHMNLLEHGILNYITVPLMATPLDFTLEEVEKMPLAAQTILMKDHVMEKDKETILSLLGAILLLCSSKASRTFLRDNNIYPIIREFDKHQEDEEIKQEVVEADDDEEEELKMRELDLD